MPRTRTATRRPLPPRRVACFTALLMGGFLLPGGGASGQADAALPRLTQLPASTRAMALGDAYAASSGHADAVFYHPALVSRASGFGVDVQRWSEESTSAAVSAAVSWFGGTVAVGLRTLQASSVFGAPIAPDGQDDLFELGSVNVSERAATVAYSRDFFFGLDVGVAVDLVDERVGSDVHGVTLFDVGLAGTAGPVVLALTAQDIGRKPMRSAGEGPSRVTLGAGAYGRPVGPLDVGFAAHVGLDRDDADTDVTFGGGVEIGYWPVQGRTFVARVGVQDVPEGSDASALTTGFAFWGDDITVEWAFRPFSGADEGGTHRFGVRWR